jgi:hypothetical protein
MEMNLKFNLTDSCSVPAKTRPSKGKTASSNIVRLIRKQMQHKPKVFYVDEHTREVLMNTLSGVRLASVAGENSSLKSRG